MASFPLNSGRALEWRGIVEGFYGPPWSTGQRRAQLRFAARHGLNAYVLAPKDDPYHRARWREPYPADVLAGLGELAGTAAASGIRFVAAIAPGLDWRHDDPDETARLERKADGMRAAGIRHFALLFDDIPGFDPADAGLGAQHGEVVAGFAQRFGGPLLVCPADYSGTDPSPYRDALAATLPADALIAWSGPSVVSAEVTAADVKRAAASYRRRIVLWDNVPVNDFDRARVYLGPLRGRPAASALAGLLANPMIEPAASRITLATAAEYARDPRGYDPEAAAGRALVAEAGADADRLRPLAEACGGWPPDADTGADLRPLVAAALAGDVAGLRDRLGPLAALPESEAAGPEAAGHEAAGPVATELQPWLAAGRDMARAGLEACALLAGGSEPGRVRAALDRAEQHWPNVLRDVLSPFVRAALPRTGDEPGRPYALLVAGPVAGAGEERLLHLLRGHGLAVRRSLAAGAPPTLVVVSRSAGETAAVRAAALPVPVLALFHLVALGLARRSGVLMREERVVITAPGHPLAGGRRGPVPVFRGPAMARWGEPGPDATVVARAEEEPRPVIVHYPPAARLADGSRAPAARAALFLGRDVLAPWVVTADGVALVDAAIGALLASAGAGDGSGPVDPG